LILCSDFSIKIDGFLLISAAIRPCAKSKGYVTVVVKTPVIVAARRLLRKGVS
jgi:hypothetical protein